MAWSGIGPGRLCGGIGGGGRDWACGAVDGIGTGEGPGEGGGSRGTIEHPAKPAASPRTSIRHDDRAGLV